MRNAVTNIPRLLLLTNSESSPINDGLPDVAGRHGTHAGWLADPDGLLEGPVDPGAYPDDRLGDLDGRDGYFAGPVGVVRCWPQRVHHAVIVAGHDEGPLRLVEYPDGLLACLGCLAEDRGGLLEGPADPGGNPACLVACLEDLGVLPPLGSRSVHSWDRCTR